ncbi:alpha-amylase [Candidatus Amesbacteria bacterium RIFCSPHIGHO2_01_FULL_48_32]|uniref:Alpha-amylase n=1 Tax=Candidatus Amesbacteria bacterium RIFCSPLOWO2_01_FULL_48_25 TaxID=1797259 RepID=A0A1F4ZDS6_9BACT|nr:MAG: alpha-amylase [Candidatus Amesbacteria bacterium RIFCSPHIGHO2_01_FULL_48_32]OGD03827.1 MAG: alpha-amylase [Candidatus Amesbacteria bacterium RIFCSPLOWO2_01_FULL_48_25]HJZ05061.1 glycoside hydrolase family 57 protein [Patescibacteria group bacterium]
MPALCLYFQVHQPLRLKKYRMFDIGHDHQYFNDSSDSNRNNLKILSKVAAKSYLPTNAILAKILKNYPQFKVSFSFSGVFLEQLETHLPHVLESFQSLVNTGRVEILSETYYHSLSFLYSPEEFASQIKLHQAKVKKLFRAHPQVFRNTELIYNNDLAKYVESLGFKGILAEGVDHILGWRSPNFVYQPHGTKAIKLLLKNYRLSDDIAFRFSSHDWPEYPLTAPKFASWINGVNGSGEVVNLFMDYETFGEHQWADTGIFDFLASFPGQILKHPDNSFVTPSEAIDTYPIRDTLDIPNFISWADVERDLSAWLGNPMQHDALHHLYSLESQVLRTKDYSLIDDWRKLQISDHFYYMCTKWFSDGDVHKYFNPHDTPYEAFISFMNALQDLKLRISQSTSSNITI